MRRLTTLLATLAVTAAVPMAARTAFAHGGQYRGPVGEVPPDSRQPEDPPPPDSGGQTPTPPDSGGTTPTPPDSGGQNPTPPDSGGTGEGADPGSGSGPGTPSNGPRTTSGRGPARKTTSFESWRFWWNYNKDGLMDLRGAMRSGAGNSGGALAPLAADDAAESGAERISSRALEAETVPLLLRCATDAKAHADVRGSSLVALAKMGRREALPLLLRIAAPGAGEPALLEESAVLALGILQDPAPEVRRALRDVAADPSRRTRSRGFACFSVGLLGNPTAEDLAAMKSLVLDPATPADLRHAALVGIGLLGDGAAVPDLLAWLETERAGSVRLSDTALAFTAAALGKIGRPGVSGAGSDEVVRALAETIRRRHRLARYSAIIALGQVAPRGDAKVAEGCVRMLARVARSEGKDAPDGQATAFALVALGRCGAAAPDLALPALTEALEGKGRERSYAALGLALLGRELPGARRDGIPESIRRMLGDLGGDVETRGAPAIALGLLRDARAVPQLAHLLEEATDDALRGTAALSLGLVGDPAGLEPVHRALVGKSDGALRVEAATAAGLLQDAGAVPALLAILGDDHASQFARGSAATALGRVGDARALPALCRMLRDEKSEYSDVVRALAAVALGQIGDRSDVPVLSRLSEDVNYRAQTDSLAEALTIL